MRPPFLCLVGLGSLSFAQVNPDWASNQEIVYDTVKDGPEIELQHLYYDQFPTGIAVSREGRKFSNYPPGLDANNTNNGSNGKYTIAELTGNRTEAAWPSVRINNPPGGAINYTTSPPTGANYADFLIGCQSIVIDSVNRAWILDTGRALTADGTLVPATPGGPKLVGVSLANDTVFQTIVFPPTVAYPDSYLNDVRIDVSRAIAYITDSSTEGRNGIVVADLASGASWRHLDGNPAVRPEGQNVEYLWGVPLYVWSPGRPVSNTASGADGIALSADGARLFWKAIGSRSLYSIPTARLRDHGASSEVRAQAAVTNHGQSGVTDGMETDTNDLIYHGNMEQNALGVYNPSNGTDRVFVRDARLNWIDTMAVGFDGYLYFTNNQVVFGSGMYPGTDRRRKPFSMWRVKLPGNGTKIA